MPSLDQHQSGDFARILYLGNSGTGKTGSLTSLVPDYDLRIIDLDNGLDPLVNFTRQLYPQRLSSIQYESYRDRYKAGPMGPIVEGLPKAFVNVAKALDKWPSDGSKPEEWGPGKILVLDSLTQLGKAAFEWARAQNPSSKDPRQWYRGAQEAIDNIIALLTSETFRTNVIVCTHIDYVEGEKGEVLKGFASSVGKALGPKIPRYFNTTVLAEATVLGSKVRREIKTIPNAIMQDLKNPAPMRIDAAYPLETGLGTLFKQLKAAKG